METIVHTKLLCTFLFSLFFLTLIGQNCGLITSTSFIETTQMDGSRDFEVTINFGTTNGGTSDAKDIEYTIVCGGNTYISSNCLTVNEATPPSVETFTIPAGDNCEPEINWTGHTSSNGNCVGTTCAGGDIALPVELIDFDASTLNNYVLLEWETASEEDNGGFEIERSKNGKTWQTLGFVKGQGTSLKYYKYKWVDEIPMQGVNYYRLKQIDTDGKFDYSKIITITFHNKESFLKLAPNPTNNFIHYSIKKEVKRITLIDALGKNVFTTLDINGTLLLNHLPSGLYTIIFEMNSGNYIVSKIVKKN